jgi:asparagine synthase (glutamine-hydrolysing)
MCGIAGKVGGGAAPDRAVRGTLDEMCAAMTHRGPDSRGVHLGDGVAMAMTRLAVIDPEGGGQPLYSEDGRVVLVLNGEIYNHRELRRELRARGHRLGSGSDAEVVVHLWEDEGERCVERLRGMFAFAIWDSRRRVMFCARDRLGKKPLHYVARPWSLTFASEVGALLRDPDVPRDIDLEAVDAFLAHEYVPGDRSVFAAIRRLPPASTLTWTPGSEPVISSYWNLDFEPKARIDRAEAVERVRELVLDAVRVRLESDVPLGAFLSGGIDSSAVVAAMAMQMGEPVKTFSAAFAERGFDEREHARRVARRYGTDHHELEVSALDPTLPVRVASHFAEPFADAAALPSFALAELTRGEVTVALGGDGGDEAFAGYRRYWQIHRTIAAERVPAGLRRGLAAGLRTVANGNEGGRVARAARVASRLTVPPGRRYGELCRFFGEEDRRRLYGPALRPLVAGANPLAEVERAWGALEGLHAVDRATATDVATYLPNDLLVKADITTMAHSLELRSPLLDHRLLEFAAALPVEMKMGGAAGKSILREAISDWLPPEITGREKHGFVVPVGEWMRSGLRPLVRELLLDREARGRGLFDHREVRALLDEHDSGRDRSSQLWPMLNLELWYRNWVDSSPAAAPAAPAALAA